MDDLLTRAQARKEDGNSHYLKQEYQEAIECYTDAIRLLTHEAPSPQDDSEENTKPVKEDLVCEVEQFKVPCSVYYSNRAACYLAEQKWEEAVKDCTSALNLQVILLHIYEHCVFVFESIHVFGHLEIVMQIERDFVFSCFLRKHVITSTSNYTNDFCIVNKPDYMKALLRRAKANEELSKLSDALKDYQRVVELDPKCKEAVEASHSLPPRIKEQQEKEKAEMMAKLKEVGNSFLGLFGLSTDNFQMVQDPNTGSYSVNFKQ